LNEHGDKVKIHWQDKTREDYHQLSSALQGYISEITDELSSGQRQEEYIRENTANYEDAARNRFSQVYSLVRKNKKGAAEELANLINRQDEMDNSNLVNLIKENTSLVNDTNLQQEIVEACNKFIDADTNLQKARGDMKLEAFNLYKDKKIIYQDSDRLTSISNWTPFHTSFSKHDMRDLSKKMFNASPDQKEMICSEFAARSISSTIDQLNKLTSYHLINSGALDAEEQVLKNPISKKEKFSNLHPERLVTLLDKSGCLEKMDNPYLKNLIQVENTARDKTQTMEYNAALPKQIYSVLQNAKNLDDFKDKAGKVVNIYLKSAKIEDNIISQAKENTLNNSLEDVYKQYTKKPDGILQKISNACIKTLEFCKIRTKDQGIKKNLDNIIKDINKDIKLSQEQSNNVKSSEDKKIPATNRPKSINTPLNNNKTQTWQEKVKMSKPQTPGLVR
jgi:hypothetical protein